MPTAKRTSKKERPPAAGEVEREMLERINATKFDRSGLRIHTAPLARDEYDFRNVESWEAGAVARYEYAREIRRHYDGTRLYYDAVGGSRRARKEMVNWKYPAPNPLPYHVIYDGLFPMPWMEYRRIMGKGKQPVIDRIAAVEEVDQEWFDQGVKSDNTDLSFHRLRIDWSRGSKAIQRELLHWIGSMAKTRSRAKRPVDYSLRLQQLAAWRASRAGMDASEFFNLRKKAFKMSSDGDFKKARINQYDDPSTFNDACRLVDALLGKLLIFSERSFERVVKR